MLREITIENVAVIEKATAAFDQGFTVLTGETGAGKSILIDSLGAILGNRTSRDVVRSGAEKAAIWASFEGLAPAVRQKLEEAGYPCEEELLLQREIGADGKGACRINGMPATAAMLREVCGGLVNIHGQHDNHSLMDPATHLAVLDAFAAHEALLAEYAEAYAGLAALRRELKALDMDEAEKNRRLDLLRYEVDEIDSAALTEGEEERLTEQRDEVRNARQIVQCLNEAYYALNGGDEDAGAATLLARAAAALEQGGRHSPALAKLAEAVNEAYYTVGELAGDVQSRLSRFEFGGDALEELEERLDLLYRLKQKYGPTVEAVMAYGEKARQALEGIESSAQRLQQLAEQEARAAAAAQKLADGLSANRAAAFEKLNSEITGALDFLNMPGIAMALRHQRAALGPTGQDEVEFYIATNPGEAPKPLARIASGGELARIMLAIKSALAHRDDVPTVIYDEIDTGISGLAAGRIGKLLRDTAAGRQVICVTHTAQIAAYARRHLLIEKRVEGGRTYTQIRELDTPGRVEELARIISGDNITDLARANAEEMLAMAGQGR